MMSAWRATLYRSQLLLVVGLVVLVSPVRAATPQADLKCHLPSERFLLGEPIELEIILCWENPTPGLALITSQNFLEIEVMTADGNMLVTPPEWVELYSTYDSGCEWCDRTIILTSEKSEWHSRIRLDYRYRLDTPDSYTVVVRWETPPYGEEEINPRLQRKVDEGFTPLLKPFMAEVKTTVELRCPEEEYDRQAFELLAGGSCPGTYLASRVLVAESERLEDLLLRYPTSAYAGFAIERRLPDLDDWRIKAGRPVEIVRSIKTEGPRQLSKQSKELFEMVEKQILGGLTATQLSPRLWEFYGEQLLLRGKIAEAEQAFSSCLNMCSKYHSFYCARAHSFLEALRME